MFDPKNSSFFINLDKPAKISSARAVAIAKRVLHAKKVGHCGTLDPFATGVLPLAINKATKQASLVVDSTKKYCFNIVFGENRDTQDIEGQITQTSKSRPTPESLILAMSNFVGKISQVPPQFSAIKVAGKKAYEHARKGEEIKLSPRIVEIKAFTLQKTISSQSEEGSGNKTLKIESASFEVECSKGTYIRAICRDLCEKLQVCGYVGELRRTKVGEIFNINSAISLTQLRMLAKTYPLFAVAKLC